MRNGRSPGQLNTEHVSNERDAETAGFGRSHLHERGRQANLASDPVELLRELANLRQHFLTSRDDDDARRTHCWLAAKNNIEHACDKNPTFDVAVRTRLARGPSKSS